MPTIRRPRSGSMQFWPRVRAKREYTRIRSWPNAKDAKPLGFAGYKVGMTHVMVTDNRPNSATKGKDISMPVTVVECPPLFAISYRLYKTTQKGKQAVCDVYAPTVPKELKRKTYVSKSSKKDAPDFDDVVLVVATQPKLTGIGKKKPEVFEIGLGGKKDDKLKAAQDLLGKELQVSDVVKAGDHVDIHSVTTGKGFQGPIRRFGIAKRSHRSEKAIRNPGSLGPWNAQGKISWRVPHAGQTGYHTRTEYNKWIISLGDKPEDVAVAGGYINYGVVKNNYLLFKGSIGGPKKRLIQFTMPVRSNKKIPKDAPSIVQISNASHQGN